MPQELSTPQETPRDAAQTPFGSMTHALMVRPERLTSQLYGAVLVFIAAFASLAIASSYVPMPEPQAQIAAVAEAEEVPDPFDGLVINAKAAYVYDVTAQEELFAQGADLQLPLASITKVMMALVVNEVLLDEDIIEVSTRALERGEGGLNWGEAWRMRDLLDFTLVASSNVGAEALAEKADSRLRQVYPSAPARNATVWRMNALAQAIGLTQTEFDNVSGLDVDLTTAGALGSARDVAKLFEYAIETDVSLFAATKKAGLSLSPLNFPQRYANNTNNAIADIPGIVMGKTGTTDLAGGNLAVAFEAEGHTIVVVVLGATPEGRFGAVTSLVDAARDAVSAAQ